VTTLPAKIGKYEILEQIGAGGFGAVYKARDPIIKRLVAVKLCTADDEQLRKRFYREAEISGNLHNPNIVTVFDSGVENGAPYLIQEYLGGEDLDRVIRRGDDLPKYVRVECLMQVAKGLRYAHRKGVLHRDVKPGNVRLLEGGQAKLMDFGIATLKSSHTRLTRIGTLVGTVGYLAPEQLRGSKADERVDIFSFGVLAYELLTYQRPFKGDDWEAVCRDILETEPEPLGNLISGYPAELIRIVERCLQKNPEDRYSSFDEILPALNPVLVALRPERRRIELQKRHRRSRLAWWLGVGLGGLLLALLVLRFACAAAPA
jgi:serine/threonine protein kinase